MLTLSCGRDTKPARTVVTVPLSTGATSLESFMERWRQVLAANGEALASVSVAVCLPLLQNKTEQSFSTPNLVSLWVRQHCYPPGTQTPAEVRARRGNPSSPQSLSLSREARSLGTSVVGRSCSLLTPKSDIPTGFWHREKRARWRGERK